MTSRERVMASLNFKQPDQVPIDFNGHRSSGISVGAYKRLREHLDLAPSQLYVYDVVQQLAIVEQDVLDMFKVDTLQLGCDFDRLPEYWKEFELEDGTPCKVPAVIDIRKTAGGNRLYNANGVEVAKQPKGCKYFEQSIYPLEDDEDFDDFSNLDSILTNIMWNTIPCPPMPINYLSEEGNKKFLRIASETRDSTNRAIYGIFGGNLVETGSFTFGMENFLCDLLANPERIHLYLDALLAKHMTELKAYLDAVGNNIDVIGFSDDMGTQTGPQFSQEVYMEFFYPREKKMWSYVHERFPEMKICLHCCGGIRPLLPLLADAGLDAINPVQFTCKDMGIKELKRELYGKLALWGGGCDTRDILPKGYPLTIAPHVREHLELLNEGGGFIFQQVHNILDDVPPENIKAMYEAVNLYNEPQR